MLHNEKNNMAFEKNIYYIDESFDLPAIMSTGLPSYPEDQNSDQLLSMDEVFLRVITSYSIHYTKLYE